MNLNVSHQGSHISSHCETPMSLKLMEVNYYLNLTKFITVLSNQFASSQTDQGNSRGVAVNFFLSKE